MFTVGVRHETVVDHPLDDEPRQNLYILHEDHGASVVGCATSEGVRLPIVLRARQTMDCDAPLDRENVGAVANVKINISARVARHNNCPLDN